MSYSLKTLVVFDTNTLRKVRTNAKEREIIDYSNFDFGAPFKKIHTYVTEKKIADIIHLSIPEMVLRELMTQCERQYQKEQKTIEDALSRIAEIPHKTGLSLNDPDAEFQYKEFIQTKITETVDKYSISVSEYFVGVLNEALQEKTMITIDEIEQPIREYKIINPNSNVSRLPPTEEGEENITISSKIEITYKWDDGTKVQEVEATTLLSDEETKEPISIEFDFDLQ